MLFVPVRWQVVLDLVRAVFVVGMSDHVGLVVEYLATTGGAADSCFGAVPGHDPYRFQIFRLNDSPLGMVVCMKVAALRVNDP